VDLVHELDVDEDPAALGDRAVRQARPARARDHGDPEAVGELDHLGDLLGGLREDRHVGHVVGPAVHGERRGHPGAVHPRGRVGQHAVGVADDRAQLLDHRLVDRALVRDGAHAWASDTGPVGVAAGLDARRQRDELEEVEDLERLGASRRPATAAARTTGTR
jgi:hypothetical protein